MSHIPNSAMPHAGGNGDAQQDQSGDTATLGERARDMADTAMESARDMAGSAKDYARENPKTAIAAGAALAVGVIAAAAIPLVRGRSGSSEKKSGGSRTKTSAAKKSSPKKKKS